MSGDADHTVSALGGTDFAIPLAAAAAIVLLLLRQWRGALTLVLAVVATQGVVQLIKVWVERPRPAANDALAEAAGFSFPSAHSATSMALYATLALVAARACRGTGLRLAVLTCAAAVVAAIGLSRIVLGAHYPIDVLAGWLTGAALVAASWLLAQRLFAAGRSAHAGARAETSRL
jgi:undecaprenyl-diphosphatase